MAKTTDILTAAIAPIVWGTTYYVTTAFLPSGYLMTAAMLRDDLGVSDVSEASFNDLAYS